ncbi:Retinol Dehydrogenase 12 [Manis pentadactyla]|nr:Retinol Dehydrogenase 12 [Manis pentadactyla]
MQQRNRGDAISEGPRHWLRGRGKPGSEPRDGDPPSPLATGSASLSTPYLTLARSGALSVNHCWLHTDLVPGPGSQQDDGKRPFPAIQQKRRVMPPVAVDRQHMAATKPSAVDTEQGDCLVRRRRKASPRRSADP